MDYFYNFIRGEKTLNLLVFVTERSENHFLKYYFFLFPFYFLFSLTFCTLHFFSFSFSVFWSILLCINFVTILNIRCFLKKWIVLIGVRGKRSKVQIACFHQNIKISALYHDACSWHLVLKSQYNIIYLFCVR